jgi:hypothetical protein
MEFAIVNNYMGPVATKAMKGYSEEDISGGVQDLKVTPTILHQSVAYRGGIGEFNPPPPEILKFRQS